VKAHDSATSSDAVGGDKHAGGGTQKSWAGQCPHLDERTFLQATNIFMLPIKRPVDDIKMHAVGGRLHAELPRDEATCQPGTGQQQPDDQHGIPPKMSFPR
jgi:hypothetical protein